ncbi:hypothetical protein B566_EDAN013481 [Ephemera danica]|nr:hypothetical protein B566_EDAN013481 [Ephemera danica]
MRHYCNLAPDEASPFCIRKYWTVQFFLLPTFLILLSNVGFFISTSIRIRKIDLEGQEILQNEDFRIHNKLEKQRFKIYLKLFAVTGGSWCLTITGAIVLFILDQTTNKDKSLSDHILYGIGTLVGLQSIGIFIACVWATDLRNLLLQRLLPAKLNQKICRRATESNNVNNFTLSKNDANT